MIIRDTYLLSNLEILEEGKAGGKMRIRGIFQRSDEANNNKRIYSKKLLEREVNKLLSKITERTLVGELDHPEKDSVKLANASHLITGLTIKGNEVVGEAEILNTPAGQVAQALIKGGVRIGISSRGVGTLTEQEDGTKLVNDDFNLVTWDLVADPSTRGAFPELKESTENSELAREILNENLAKIQQEKLFVEVIKSKLNEGFSIKESSRKRTSQPHPLISSLVEGSSGLRRNIRIWNSKKPVRQRLSQHKDKNLDIKAKVKLVSQAKRLQKESVKLDPNRVDELFGFMSMLKRKLKSSSKPDPRTRKARSSLQDLYKKGGTKALKGPEAQYHRSERMLAARDRLRKKGFKLKSDGLEKAKQSSALKASMGKTNSSFAADRDTWIKRNKRSVRKNLDLAHTEYPFIDSMLEGSMGLQRQLRAKGRKGTPENNLKRYTYKMKSSLSRLSKRSGLERAQIINKSHFTKAKKTSN